MFTAVAAAVLIGVLSVADRTPAPTADADWTVAKEADLERALLHAEPGSPQAFKLQMKIDRLHAWREGRPQPGFPDEFERVLYERKIPSDREAPEYDGGYRKRELEKAPRSLFADKAGTWASRGPGNVSGRARGIIVDPIDPAGLTWFIVSVGGGIWKTDDGGATWRVLTDDVPNLAMQSIAMAASDNDVMYAGTGESFFNIDTLHGDGLLKSVDRGETWTQVASTLSDYRFNNVSRILVDPTDPDVVVISTTTGRYKADISPSSSIFRSTDGGTSWTEVHTETGADGWSTPRVQQLVADPADFSIQYATVDGKGIMKSTDAGLTWNYVNNGITDFTGRFEMDVSPVNSDYLYASAEGSSHAELWVSWNQGASWVETVESGAEPNWLASQGWYDNTIVCHPTDPTIVYVGGTELYELNITAVGGSTRNSTPLASYWFPHPDHHGLAIVQPSGGGWFLLGTNDGGITRTASGVSSFTMPIDGMTSTQFYGVDKRPGGSAYVGGMQDNGTWRSPLDPDDLTPWTAQIGGDGYETSWHFDDPLKIIGGYQFNGLQRSLDGGATWVNATSGMSDTGSGSAPFITKIAKSQDDPELLFAVGASGVWRSTDFGGSWSLANTPSAAWGSLSSFMDVRISRADPDVVWAGHRMDGSGSIVVSTDGGLNFSATTNYTTATMGGISGLATHPVDAGTAYVLFSFAQRPKVLKTVDGGASWTDISGFGAGTASTNGFPDVAVYDLLVWPNDPNRIWVGSEIGLIESLDGGATWALAANGLPAVGVWMLKAVEDEIVVATHGRGIWSYTDPALENGRTYRPLLENLVQAPTGDMLIEMNLRSAYDSTGVWVDGVKAASYGPTTRRQLESLSLPVVGAGTRSVFVRGWKDGAAYESVTRTIDVYDYASPAFDYATSFPAASDFALSGFTMSTPSGFSNDVLNTAHPYPDADTAVALLTVPIQVSLATTLTFDEVAIIEPGDPGTIYGDSGFWDYAVVEGSLDGVTWTALAPGWDARDETVWLNAYNSGSSGNSSMFRQRTITINDTFAPGETIVVRFRLYADAVVNGWGWAIDDLSINSTGVTAVDETPSAFTLAKNYPNPFNPKTTIAFNLDRSGPVKLRVYDVRGHLVRTLLDDVRGPGAHRIDWNGRDDRGRTSEAGVYFYRLEAGGRTLQDKMTLVK
jgi:photosystem II stability/assembly factor-like uncharacterized protein